MGIIMKNKVCYSNGGNTTIQPIIYSDTEREVGVWRDGKPLYQITISATTDYVVNKTTWTHITDLDSIAAIMDSLVFVEVASYSSQDDSWTIRTIEFSYNKGVSPHVTALSLRDGDDYIDTNSRITLRYTKTTDTAGSGTWTPSGVPAVHYSTDEQIIGTWIDGKTLYQKTYYYTHNDTISDGYTTIGTISGYEYLQFVNCMLCNPTVGRYYSIPYANGSVTTVPHLENGNIQLRVSNDTWGPTWDVVITVQYTKASS